MTTQKRYIRKRKTVHKPIKQYFLMDLNFKPKNNNIKPS